MDEERKAESTEEHANEVAATRGQFVKARRELKQAGRTRRILRVVTLTVFALIPFITVEAGTGSAGFAELIGGAVGSLVVWSIYATILRLIRSNGQT